MSSLLLYTSTLPLIPTIITSVGISCTTGGSANKLCIHVVLLQI